VEFDLATYAISNTISVTVSHTLLEGKGPGYFHDVSDANLKYTRFKWIGAANGTMLRFTSVPGPSNQKQVGGGIKKIFLDGSSAADIGLQVISWNYGEFDKFNIENFLVTAIDMNVVAALGEPTDPQRNRFTNFTIRTINNPGGTGSGIRLDGDALHNTSFNTFENFDISFQNSTAIDLYNSDNNIFIGGRTFRAAGGTGLPIEFHGSNDADNRTARHNSFSHFSAAGISPATFKGTTSYTYPSKRNNLFLLDSDNATQAPTLEPGATASWSFSSGIVRNTGYQQIAAGEGFAGAIHAQSIMGPTNSLIVQNGSGNHVVLTNLDDSKQWSLRVNSSTGNLEAISSAGGGWQVFNAPETRQIAVGQGVAGAAYARSRLEATNSAIIENGSGAHLVLTNLNGTQEWMVRVNSSTGDLDLTRIAGSGNVVLGRPLFLPVIETFADNAAAISGGAPVGKVYKTATGQLMIRY
jgi:hypothetical protein